MAIPEPGSVLPCAVGPCINPAEVTIHTPGYGPYPPLIFDVCQVCFNAFGTLLAQWPKRTHIDGHGEVRTLPERTPTRSPYVMTGMVKARPHPYPWPPIPVGEMDIRAGSLASKYDEVEDPPSYLDDALAFANMALLAALDEDLRRIEAHPASNPEPEPEQHAPGWLPGDD